MFLSLALCWTCPLLEKAVSPVLFLFSQLAYPKPSDEGIAASVLITISRPFLQKPHLTWSACCEITVHLPNLPCCILSSRLFSKGHCLPLSISLLTDFHHADIYPTLNSQFLDSFPVSNYPVLIRPQLLTPMSIKSCIYVTASQISILRIPFSNHQLPALQFTSFSMLTLTTSQSLPIHSPQNLLLSSTQEPFVLTSISDQRALPLPSNSPVKPQSYFFCLLSLYKQVNMATHGSPLKITSSPDRHGSVGWESIHNMKGRRFDSQAGLMPELQAQSLVGVCNASMFLSHIDVSLPLPPFPSLQK